MRNLTNAAILVLFLIVPLPSSGQEKTPLADAMALEEALESLITVTEPSIACILVSRSEDYGQYNAAPSKESPGKLGRFDGERLLRSLDRFPAQQPERDRLVGLTLSHPEHTPESFGSGIVIDESGLVLTCAHVVRNATKVYVRLPGGKGSYADIHAADPRSDLAVLKLLDPLGNLKPLKTGDGGKLRKGQLVVQLAHPYAAGFRDGSPTASWGMVANRRRRAPGARGDLDRERRTTLHHYGTLLQLDTRITLGCSGGAVLNLHGELVGITTALAGITGVDTPGGFAVPFDSAMRRILDVLKRGEEVEYGFLGVMLSSEPQHQAGVQISGVAEGSPAGRAGLAAGDVLLTINDAPVRDNDDLFLHIGGSLAGSTARIEVSRQGQKLMKMVKLAKYYVPGPIIASRRPPARFGLRVDYTSILNNIGNTLPDGVAIREVVPEGPADKAQLHVDQIITSVNGQAVSTPAEYNQAMATTGRSVKFTIAGKQEPVTLEGP